MEELSQQKIGKYRMLFTYIEVFLVRIIYYFKFKKKTGKTAYTLDLIYL